MPNLNWPKQRPTNYNTILETIYYAYTGFIIAAKALLLSKDVECNTQIKILRDFDTHLVNTGEFSVAGGFENFRCLK